METDTREDSKSKNYQAVQNNQKNQNSQNNQKNQNNQNNQKEIWMLRTKRADFHGLAASLGVSPVTVRILRNRGMETEEDMRRYLFGTMEDCHAPGLLKGMDEAIKILIEKLSEKKKIRIIGDYDIDGVCSTYLLLTGLKRAAGVLRGEESKIDFEIPDRIRDGYGINESIIRQAVSDGVETIITCDNGIAAAKEIAFAREQGITVIVTDHHEVPVNGETGAELLPPANAVVNPKQQGDRSPFHEICGAVVVYKLLYELYRNTGVPVKEWQELLQFAAIATVGDVMRLQDENRLIVKYGLMQMARTENIGLRKLAEKNGLELQSISAYHIGFVIGPCLNAGGRLQTAKLALKLLMAEDETEADCLAGELKALNDTRKEMTRRGEEAAVRQVEEALFRDKVLVVFLPDCHESLAGIIAGRVRERFNKPSFVLTKGETSLKGSGRSIEQYHMYQGLCQVADLLLKFGGHPMAAGLSIKEENLEEFRRRLNENAALTEEDFIPRIWIDVPMPLDYLTEELVTEIRALEPFGQGNEKPQFAQKDLFIKRVRVLGKDKNLAKLSLITGEGRPMDGLLFTDGEAFLREQAGRDHIDIVYYPDVNEYNGTKTLQAVIKHYKLH